MCSLHEEWYLCNHLSSCTQVNMLCNRSQGMQCSPQTCQVLLETTVKNDWVFFVLFCFSCCCCCFGGGRLMGGQILNFLNLKGSLFRGPAYPPPKKKSILQTWQQGLNWHHWIESVTKHIESQGWGQGSFQSNNILSYPQPQSLTKYSGTALTVKTHLWYCKVIFLPLALILYVSSSVISANLIYLSIITLRTDKLYF